MNYKVGIVSLGCAKNQVDAEMLLYTLKNRGFIIVNDPADADAVIVNTCGFIESAKQESINEIIELGKLKDEGKIKAIIVTGCLAQRYKSEISNSFTRLTRLSESVLTKLSQTSFWKHLTDRSAKAFPTRFVCRLRAEEFFQLPPTPLISKLPRVVTTVVPTVQSR